MNKNKASDIKKRKDNTWNVFVTSEKGNLTGLKTYSDGNVTLDDFVERLRTDKRLREYFKA